MAQLLLLALATAIATPAAAAGNASKPALVTMYAQAKSGLGDHPISKVVGMLEELAKECETNVKMEQDMFDTYTCWKNKVQGLYKAGINDAQDRIEALANYIDDIDSGRIEFSSEGADMTAEVNELKGEMEKAAALRKKDNEDFLAAKDEMESTIAALEGAVAEMEEGTQGAFFAKAVAMGQDLLKPSDAALLESAVASGNLRSPDYKKMNRKKAFNMKFTKRSGKIQELMKDMLKTFQDNLADAKDKEADAKATYKKLKSSKDSQLASAEDALAELGGETAAREDAKAEAEAETKNLEAQIVTDKGFITSVEDAYKEKQGEWKERKNLMTQEIAAIRKAQSILSSDEARDAMSKTFDSNKVFNQAPSLMQVASSVAKTSKVAVAAAALRAFADAHLATGGRRLKQLAASMDDPAEGEGGFAKVIKLMNNIKVDLNKEAKDDAEKGKQCEKDLTEKTSSAQVSSNFIDDKSRYINRTEFAIAELYATVNKTIGEIEDMEWDLNDATREREQYHEAFLQEQSEMATAIEFIKTAKAAMQKFYDDNGLSLAQQGAKRRVAAVQGAPIPLIIEAGKEPPPPPAVITAEFKGSAGNVGIQAILDTVAEDVTKDKEELEKTEEDSQKHFKEMKQDTEDSIQEKLDLKAEKEDQIAEKLKEKSDANEAKVGEKVELDAVVRAMKTMEPDCDYVFTTRETRIRNRALECEGVDKALKELEGDIEEVKCEEPADE